jgi:hypothetical protein
MFYAFTSEHQGANADQFVTDTPSIPQNRHNRCPPSMATVIMRRRPKRWRELLSPADAAPAKPAAPGAVATPPPATKAAYHLDSRLVGPNMQREDLAALDLKFVRALAVSSHLLLPAGDGSLVEAEGGDESPVRWRRRRRNDSLRVSLEPGLVAQVAAESFAFYPARVAVTPRSTPTWHHAGEVPDAHKNRLKRQGRLPDAPLTTADSMYIHLT